MPGRSRGFPRGHPSRRRTEWFFGVGGTALASQSDSSAQFLGASVTTSFGEETVVRIRGLFDMFLVSSTSPGDGFFGAVGIGIATVAAITAGVASVPTPITEQDWDGWLWHHFFSVHESSADEAGSGSSHHRMEIDSKAMRRLQGDMGLYAMVEAVEIGTAAASMFLDTRMLSKLP